MIVSRKSYYKDLAVKFGLRLNHHNIGDFKRRARSHDYKHEATTVERILARSDKLTESTFILAFLEAVTEDDLSPEISRTTHKIDDPRTQQFNHELQAAINRACEFGGDVNVSEIAVLCGFIPGDSIEVWPFEGKASKSTFTIHGIENFVPIDRPLNPNAIKTTKPYTTTVDGPLRMNFAQLQLEHYSWVQYNFPEQLHDENRALDGFIGTVEELGELAASILKLRQGIRGTKEEWKKKQKDAVGDIVIFLTSFCASNGLDLQECVEIAWSEVKERDWVKYPKTGMPPAHGVIVDPGNGQKNEGWETLQVGQEFFTAAQMKFEFGVCSVDGDCACVMVGNDLQDGEAAFSKIYPDEPQYAAFIRARTMLETRLGRKLKGLIGNFDRSVMIQPTT